MTDLLVRALFVAGIGVVLILLAVLVCDWDADE